MQHLVGRAPEQLGQPGTRWQLSTIRATCDWLADLSLCGVWRMLKRCGLRLKRGRDHLHSPDPDYLAKLADVVVAFERAIKSQGKIVLVFSDELTFYRQPTLARDYCLIGANHQPLANRSLRSNTVARVISALNAVTGKTTSLMASKIGINQLQAFFLQLRADYPKASTIYFVLDNWPIHFHPDVLAVLQRQLTRWPLKISASWSTEPRRKTPRLNLPIQLLPLPTYAPWTNPIEKFWRWLKQEVIHLHRRSDDWLTLKQKVKEFLDRFSNGSQQLLRYVGLTTNSKLYGSLFTIKRKVISGCI